MVWGKLGSDTLGSAGDSITITFTTKNFITALFHTFEQSATSAIPLGRYNSNSNSVYAGRSSDGGGADATVTSQSSMDYALASLDTFAVIFISNISGQEKLTMSFLIDSFTAGAGTAPRRREFAGKFVPSPDANITEINIINGDSGNFDVGNNLSALGTSDGDSNYIIQDGAIFHETDTNKIYQYSSTTGLWTLLS